MLETAEIDNSRAAAVFNAARQRRILLTLIPEPRSLNQLATLTETRLNLLHHHIAKFIRLGLVTVVREERRAGAPVKYYQAAARRFFVPAELMQRSPGAGMAGQLRELLDRSLADSLKGFEFSNGDEGLRMRPVREADRRTPALELWLDLRLSEADRAELSEELTTLLRRYEARSQEAHRRCIVHAALAPL